MTGSLWQDWPVYVLLGAVIFFFGYVIIKSKMRDKNPEDKREIKK